MLTTQDHDGGPMTAVTYRRLRNEIVVRRAQGIELDAQTWLGLTEEERKMRAKALDDWLEGRNSEPNIHTLTAELRERVRDRNRAMYDSTPQHPVPQPPIETVTIKKSTLAVIGICVALVAFIVFVVVVSRSGGSAGPQATYATAAELANRLKEAGVPCERAEPWTPGQRGEALDRVTCWSSDGKETIASVFASSAEVESEVLFHRSMAPITGMTDVAGANWLVHLNGPEHVQVVLEALGGRLISVPA